MANKLELTWVGKNELKNIEPRILIEDKSKTYGDSDSENVLIHGDNLLALKALEKDYSGKIKCIYIDPPYNTGNAFEYYDDNLEHSLWLNLMYSRLQILYNLLKDGGSIWISIDDVEAHRLRMIMDEIFGTSSFVADITYERSGSAGLGQGGLFVNTSEHILVYSKGNFEYNEVLGQSLLELKTMKRYNKVLVNEGEKVLVDTLVSKSNGMPIKIYRHENFEIKTISLKDFEKREEEIRGEFATNFYNLFRTNNVQKENEFQNDLMSRMDKKSLYTVEYIPSRGKNKNKETTLYYYNAELFAWLKDTAFLDGNDIVKTNKLTTVWRHEDIPKADLANEGGVDFSRSKKPEQLIRRILEIATNEGDLVLDSFLGSGTTAAVAHKMNRKWIGIEMGEHCYTHCIPRLNNVISGYDKSGVSKSLNWNGGGGYKFYELAPTLIEKDIFEQEIINPKYNEEMLREAVALYKDFDYNPSNEYFWKQSKANENSYLYVTTNFVGEATLDNINCEMKENEYLIIACTSYDENIEHKYKNIKIKKIPEMLLSQCEYGVENYALNVIEEEEVYEDE